MSKILSLEDLDHACAKNLIPLLKGVPAVVLQDYREKLRFVDNGLAHADYSMLKGYVSDGDLPKLFSHFGIEESKFADIRDSSCVGGICFVHPGAFCDPDRCGH